MAAVSRLVLHSPLHFEKIGKNDSLNKLFLVFHLRKIHENLHTYMQQLSIIARKKLTDDEKYDYLTQISRLMEITYLKNQDERHSMISRLLKYEKSE
jgi:hypothetical protein